MISENDKQKSAKQVIVFIEGMYPRTRSVEEITYLENMLIELVNLYPPGEPDEPGQPCEHGFDDNFWCAECQEVRK